MKNHLVSIIMPAFNAELYIAESIRSVYAQTYRDWELIVVDDGSSDGTARVVNEFSRLDQRVRYIFQENGGQAKARNMGLSQSSSELVAFLDSDDLWVREKLKLQIDAIDAMQVDLVFSDGYIFADEDVEDETFTFQTMIGALAGDNFFRLMFIQNRIPILSVLTRRDSLSKAGLFDESREYQMCEDYDLWLRMVRNGAVFYGMPEKLVRYRRHANASTYNPFSPIRAMLAVLRKYKYDVSLDSALRVERFTGLHRQIAAYLVEGNSFADAVRYLSALPADERRDVMRMFSTLWWRSFRINYVGTRFHRIKRPLKKLRGALRAR